MTITSSIKTNVLLGAAILGFVACSSSSSSKDATLDTKVADGAINARIDSLLADTTNSIDLAGPDAVADKTIDSPPIDMAPDSPATADTAVADRPPDVALGDTASVDAPAADTLPSGEAGVDSPVSPTIARGEYLVRHVIGCSDCHTPNLPDGTPDLSKYLAGNPNFVVLPSGDRLPTRNLTPDQSGLGNFTLTQIETMILNGTVPMATGTIALNPVMPYYVFHNMSAADANAIANYLTSIPAVANPIPARSASFDVAAPANYLVPSSIPSPATSNPTYASAIRGRYLAAETGLCIECHTKHLSNSPTPLDTSKFFQGGEDFSSFFASTLRITPVSLNITSDPTTGIGNWTAQDIVIELKTGKDKEGDGICPPMPVGPRGAYGGLTDADALDIANYIKSLPPAVNFVADICVFPPMPASDGGISDGSSDDGGDIGSDS